MKKILSNKHISNLKNIKNFYYFETDFFANLYTNNYKIENQGWKIHISATHENYIEILNIVLIFCIENCMSLKFIKFEKDFYNNISKNASRLNSGKFITIYPENEKIFIKQIKKLNKKLKNFVGPYILTDNQFKKNKVLYYRYGSNTLDLENFIICPDGTKLIDRQIGFNLPYFIKDPFSKGKEKLIKKDNKNFEFKFKKYNVLGRLAMSNGGGIYYGIDNNKKQNIIIKEARPYIGNGNDYNMINLRKNEIRFLKLLNKYDFSPKYIDSFYEDGHFFVVREFIKAHDLAIESKIYEIFLYDLKNIDEMINKFKIIIINFLNLLYFVHKKNIIINDFNKNNFLVDSNKKVYFIDFDNSYLTSDPDYKKYKITGIYLKNGDFENLEKRLDYHKLGFLLLNIISLGVNYFTEKNKGKKDIQYLNYLVNFYGLPLWVTKIIQDLIYLKNINILELKSYFDKYNFKDKKRIKLYSLFKINNIKNNLLRIINANSKNFWIFNCINDLNSKLENIETSNDLIDLLIIYGLENWNKLKLFYKISILNKNLNYDWKKLSINSMYNYILLNLFNYLNDENDEHKKNIEKIINFILLNKIKKVGPIIYIDNEKFFSPNFTNGTAGLVYILILYSKIFLTKIYDDKIKKYMDTINFNFMKKIDFSTGLAGIGYVHLETYLYLKDKNFLNYSAEKTFMINFNKIKIKKNWYFIDQNSKIINDNFQNGKLGIYFFIKKLLNNII